MKTRKKIVLGVCGSVAAIEAPKVARELIRGGFNVECVMTKAAKEIIHPNVLEWASGNKVVTRLTGAVEHVRLCGVDGEAALMLIYPATANTISKIACGIDDSPVSTFAATAIGSGIPLIVAPAMHISMYKNPFVESNIKRLKENDIRVINPRIEENKAKVERIDYVIEAVLKWI